jgi:hypothetical protein
MIFTGNKKVVAQFVHDIVASSNLAYQSITITKLEKSGVSCVHIVTDTSSEDTVRSLVRNSYRELMIIL